MNTEHKFILFQQLPPKEIKENVGDNYTVTFAANIKQLGYFVITTRRGKFPSNSQILNHAKEIYPESNKHTIMCESLGRRDI